VCSSDLTDGLGFSRDGGKTYRSAITYEGIVADAITTGTLRSIYIEAVEIYGSYIEGSTIISKRNDDDYIKLQGHNLTSYGIHNRSWLGDREDNQVRVMLQNGQFRARNDTKEWSTYLNDTGLATYADGDGGTIGNNQADASGYIEFHSDRYSPSGATSGTTIGSLA